jgi:hypothetical protein
MFSFVILSLPSKCVSVSLRLAELKTHEMFKDFIYCKMDGSGRGYFASSLLTLPFFFLFSVFCFVICLVCHR